MKRVVLLALVVTLAGMSAEAQETYALGNSIEEQEQRVATSYMVYLEACMPLTEASDYQKRSLTHALSEDCVRATVFYMRDASILANLVHGETAPSESED